MSGDSWSLTAKPCDSCKAPATVFCRADSIYLCGGCDGEVHAANKLASRHARVWLCDVCERCPATVTCKADDAALCASCDADIHSANPLARRHERIPIVPFYLAAVKTPRPAPEASEEEEEEAASWLLPDPNSKLDDNSGSPEYLYPDPDLNLMHKEQKPGHAVAVDEKKQYTSDGVVPVQTDNEYGSGQYQGPVVDGFPTHDPDFSGSKPFMYNFTSQSISHSVSSSSLEVGVVPDHNNVAVDVASKVEVAPSRLFGVEREARVMRYKEKRKKRKFDKTIRYASRKAYAETRPRVKGRFARRSELQLEPNLLSTADVSYGIVPIF